jgi:hypothetical protein
MQTKNRIRAEILQQSTYRSGKELLKSLLWEQMSNQISDALKVLLSGRDRLQAAYRLRLAKSVAKKRGQEMTFAFDGRLVGDIGELIAAETFCLDLLGTKTVNIDAKTTAGPSRKVQIKATFKDDSLSIKHGGDHFLGLQLDDAGRFRVIYNGPAAPVMKYLKAPKADGHPGRKNAGSKPEPISLDAWAVLNLAVADLDRIPHRKPELTNL